MSFDIVKAINFPQEIFQYVPQEILGDSEFEDFSTLGGILSDLKHIWHAKGPCLEVRNISSGRKVGSWVFGGILKDSNTKIIAIDELKRPYGRLPLLVIGLECTISGGLVCVFDIFGSKVLRVVQIRQQITSLHVVDSGNENSALPEPSSLKFFDGIVAIGCLGGNVYLLDICRQICESGLQNMDITIRDELNPCPMVILKKEKIASIKKYVERSVEREEHLAIHLNVVLNPSTEHFTLKGEGGDDRVHVNHSEAEVSSLFYSPQIASLLVGYNFGAFQLWDLRLLELAYTSPVCDEHIPVMHFTVQEPADDPKAYCYIWVSYSHNLMFHSGLPFAVMYSFYYENKSYINGYGNLYEDFQHCSVRFEIELGDTLSRVKGGTCIGLQSLNKYPINRDINSLSLCIISWILWNSHKEVSTSVLVFDLNQWYKEQMPRVPNWSHCSNYMIKHSLKNNLAVLDVKLDHKTIRQFIGIQRLEEHFCPTALSFDLWCLLENSVLKVYNKGLQQSFIDKMVEDQHLALVRPEDYFEQISNLGLVPLFCEINLSASLDIDYQREILLNVALEQKLVGWLCNCTSKLANNAFNASGLTIYNILNWAFERAITLKNSCDKYCGSLFDCSGTRLDNNTIALLNSCTNQIRNISSIYRYVSTKLMQFISDKEALLEEKRSLENVVVYFEVLLWMVDIGLLPECQQKTYPSFDDSFVSAPYLVHDLTKYYNRKRAQLQMASHDTFVGNDCLLFIDNLINNKGCADILRQQWQEDGGSGLYPPPSLQSLLRTYFLDGPDLVFKHSLVTYTLLDIAMTVDENNKVIKLLLKFPQIFDVTLSNIKIVQAFWHLDHDDYETALEYILDPCVLTKDLSYWQHSVMMRSLLLQEQSSLALYYFQIRKPTLQDEKDLLTVLSLLISKNMLDEAFKFRHQHERADEQALLLHIFNECNKNELLHSVLYRRLDSEEEKVFFKYLKNTRNPRLEDLKTFYYLLRSRFLEAFDSHSSTKRKKPENQGLIGQRDATTADNIVKMFKSLLPDVSKNLVELVRKERTNLWKEVPKPTPLSVFVHNAKDQVQYKSSVIFAALAKAKQTFNDTLNDTTINNEVVTDETPFLRTPTVFREIACVGTPLMKCRVIEQNEKGEEYGPSPCKKLKLSPRTSKMSPVKMRNLSSSTIHSKLSTPIIKRKRLSMEPSIDASAVLPQSILKGSSIPKATTDNSFFDENTSANVSLQLECENSVRRAGLALTPRKPVNRTPSHVKFDDLRYSGSSSEQNSKNESSLQQLIPENDRRTSVNSTASTIDDVFYSPEADDEEINQERIKNKKSLSPVRAKLNFDETMVKDDEVKEDEQQNIVNQPNITKKGSDLLADRLSFQSPKSRRSYKRSFGESPIPVRSSPRLAKKISEEDKETSSTSSDPSIIRSESPIKPSPSVAITKVRGRKSLSRAVLENNAYSKLRSSNIFEESKNLSNYSSVSSIDTTTNDTESEMDVEQSHNDSLEAFLKKYRTDSSINDCSININDSQLSDGDVSKTIEVKSIEIHRETIRRSNTHELVFSKESKEEYNLKKVEVIEQDETKFEESLQQGVAKVNTNIVEKGDVNVNTDIVENDDHSDGESKTSEKPDECHVPNEDINIYEDLSSGSEDVKEVCQQFRKKEDAGKVYTDISYSTSLSYYQSEQKESLMPENLMESGDSNSNDDVLTSEQPKHVFDNDVDMEELITDDIPEAEKAFVNSGDVIEIGSSSDEDIRKKKQKHDSDDSSSDSSESSSEDKSYSSKDSVRGSYVSNESYNIDIGFANSLNQSELKDNNFMNEESNSDVNNACHEENSSGPIQNIEQTEFVSVDDSNADNKESDENETNNMPLLQESSSNLEKEFEVDQKEIVEAVESLQEGCLNEHKKVDDDEHMDSLILEEQSPEKEAKDGLAQKVVPFDGVNDDVNQELTEDVQVKNDKLMVRQAHVANEDIQLNKQEVVLSLNENKSKFKEVKNMSTSLAKQSTSIQCTLGANDSIMECSLDNNSPFSPKNETTATYEIKIDNLDQKSESASPAKQSRGLQCTLGTHDSIMECSVDDEPKPENVKEKETTVSTKQSISLQCTLGIKDSIIDTTEPNNETETQKDQKAISMPLECSLQVTSEDCETELAIKGDTETPLVLKTVKKTYKGRKVSDADLDATPKLTVSSTRKTYLRKDSTSTMKFSETEQSNVDTSQAETQNEKFGETKESIDNSDNVQKVLKNAGNTNTDTFEENNEKTKDAVTPVMRMTRRRSMLLSQQEHTPVSSISDGSVSSSSASVKMSERAKDESTEKLEAAEHTSQSKTPETDSSQTAQIAKPNSRKLTKSAELSETVFDSTCLKDSPRVVSDVNVNATTNNDTTEDTEKRDALESNEKMEKANKPGPSKLNSRQSSKHSMKSELSISLKQLQSKKRTRSASVDQPSSGLVKKRSVRSKSIDFDDKRDQHTSHAVDLQVLLTPIIEHAGPSTETEDEEVPKHSTKTYSDVGGYTTSRRLTRRQASMLKTIGSTKKESRKLLSVKEIDPIQLLSKPDFEGQPDPDESKVYEQGSPSNSSGTPSRRTRSASVVSDAPSTPPKKKSSTKSEHVNTPVSGGIKTRLRRQSTDTMSVASEQSDSPSPSKKSKKEDTEDDSHSVRSTRKGRSRANSVSSAKSDASDTTDKSVRSTRSRRIHSAKSELPEIKEEKGSDEGESVNTSVVKKRGRKKKV